MSLVTYKFSKTIQKTVILILLAETPLALINLKLDFTALLACGLNFQKTMDYTLVGLQNTFDS